MRVFQDWHKKGKRKKEHSMKGNVQTNKQLKPCKDTLKYHWRVKEESKLREIKEVCHQIRYSIKNVYAIRSSQSS